MTYATRWLNPKDVVLNAMSATKIPTRLRLNEILVTVGIIEPEARMGSKWLGQFAETLIKAVMPKASSMSLREA